ncbi:MAG: hypothetical protein HY902_01275 [Deltaproteobacteria bacterium]|nr:hypothetical protein [Deltaproteobacteria bacterium]
MAATPDLTTVEPTESKWQDPALAEQLQTALRGAAAAEAERDDLLGERADLHRQLAAAQSALKAAREQVAQLEQAAAATGQARDAALQRLHECEAQRDRHAAATQAAERKAADLAAQQARHQTEATHLRESVDEERRARTAAETELAAQREVEASLNDLRASLADHERWLGDERQRATALQDELAGLQQHRAKVRQLAAQLREAKDKLANQSGAFDLSAILLTAESQVCLADLDSLLGEWADSPGVRAIAVGTKDGLAVAGATAGTPWLAALAAEMDRAVAAAEPWVAAHLELGEPELLQVRDRHGGALTVRRWDGLAEPLLLAVLSSTQTAKDPSKVAPPVTVAAERPRGAPAARLPRLVPAPAAAASTDPATADAPIERNHA